MASYPLLDSLPLFVLKINENNHLGLVRDRLLSALLNAYGISICKPSRFLKAFKLKMKLKLQKKTRNPRTNAP